MNIQNLSTRYTIKVLTNENLNEVYELCLGNPLYYHYCPPEVTIETIKEDMQALPPNKQSEDKYYLGFYSNNHLTAVLDLILKYPDDNTAFIGFFMMHQNDQGQGKGSAILQEICQELQHQFNTVKLGYVQGNFQSEHFWKKNQFEPTEIISHTEHYDIVIMQKHLKPGDSSCSQS